MKQKPISLKRYTVGMLVTLAIILSGLLSFQSAYYMIEGFDVVSEKFMQRVANHHIVAADKPLEIMNYHLSRSWQQQPEIIRQQFPQPPQQQNISEVVFENWIFIAPPETAYAVMKTKDQNGDLVFISKIESMSDNDEFKSHKEGWHIDPMVRIILIGIISPLIFFFLVVLIMRKIMAPVSALYDWAKSLTLTKLDKNHPDFHYLELTSLAEIIHDSMQAAEDTLKREQEFLQYASHELRTPIAVLRSNSALLEKVNPDPESFEREIRDRINRASLTMKDMTETLLWLSREQNDDIDHEPVLLGELVKHTCDDLSYLLQGKDTEIEFELDNQQSELPARASAILLNNLIRNAFQHSNSGIISISQRGNQVNIINSLEGYAQQDGQQNIGFGLGLKLCQKLADRFNWQLNITIDQHYHKVSIQF